MTAGPLVLEQGDARLTVSPADGGRMTSLVAGGEERLVARVADPIRWGCYPMAPWAGRIRDGRFTFRGRAVELPRNLPPHAIHGTVFERAWEVVDPATIAIDLGPAWPFAGRVTQRFALASDGLRVDLELVADEPMPAIVGWHPWFRRPVTLTASTQAPVRARPRRPADRVVRRARTATVGRLLRGPCRAPAARLAGRLRAEGDLDADHWVIYDEAPSGICVEPQTGPPDAVNLGVSPVAEPGEPVRSWMAWQWTPASG